MTNVPSGLAQAATPFGFRWLSSATGYALWLVFISVVYIGFSVADGRWNVIAAETTVAAIFVVVAAVAITGSTWLLVGGFTGHGLKDSGNTGTCLSPAPRWWPTFCAAVDFVVAAILAIALAVGTHVR